MLALRKPRPTKPKVPSLASVSFSAAAAISSRSLGNGDALLLEQLLIVIEDEIIDRPRQRQHLTLVVPGVLQARGREVALDEIRRGQRGVLHEGRQVGEPAGLLELPLLHVIAEMDDVEARPSRSQLDHHLLALLLLGNLLGFDLDAGELGELLDVFLQVVAARSLGEDHLELGPCVFLPVHLGARRQSRQAERASCGSARQERTTRDFVVDHFRSLPVTQFGRILAAVPRLPSPNRWNSGPHGRRFHRQAMRSRHQIEFERDQLGRAEIIGLGADTRHATA